MAKRTAQPDQGVDPKASHFGTTSDAMPRETGVEHEGAGKGLRDLYSGDEIVVNRAEFIKLMHDLVHGHTSIWTGTAGKKRLAAMLGVEGKDAVEKLYDEYKKTYLDKQTKRSKEGVYVAKRYEDKAAV